MNTTNTAPIQPIPPEEIEVSDLDQLTTMLSAWHADKVSLLVHLRDVPAGTVVEIGDSTTLVLDGDILKAYRLGIELSLEELGTLPFTTYHEEYQVDTPQEDDTPPSK